MGNIDFKYEKEDIKVVVDNIINMLSNNVEYGENGIAESFVDWCENGDVFYNEEVKEEQSIARQNIMNYLKNDVDNLTNTLYKLFDNLEK